MIAENPKKASVNKLLDLIQKKIKIKDSQFTPNFSQLQIRSAQTTVSDMESLFVCKPHYEINDFNKFNGHDFITNAFLGILNRNPEKEDLTLYFRQLAEHRFSKTELLGALRFSEEGRNVGTKILGIRKRLFIAKVLKIPILGNLLKTIGNIITINSQARKIVDLELQLFEKSKENSVFQKLLEQKIEISALTQPLETFLSETKQNLSDLNNNFLFLLDENKNTLMDEINNKIDIEYLSDIKSNREKSEQNKQDIVKMLTTLNTLRSKTEENLSKLEKKQALLLDELTIEKNQTSDFLQGISEKTSTLEELQQLTHIKAQEIENQLSLFKDDLNKKLESSVKKKELLSLNDEFKLFNEKLKKMKGKIGQKEFKSLKNKIKTINQSNLEKQKSVLDKINKRTKQEDFSKAHKELTEQINIESQHILSIKHQLEIMFEKIRESNDLYYEFDENYKNQMDQKIERDELRQMKRVLDAKIESRLLRVEFLKNKQMLMKDN